MTEGIIQKVIEKHTHVYNYPTMKRLEQELIEEIKKLQLTQIHTHIKCGCDKIDIQTMLIGDNQE